MHMRQWIGTVLQIVGLVGICVATFTISYTVGAIGSSLVCVYVGLAADA